MQYIDGDKLYLREKPKLEKNATVIGQPSVVKLDVQDLAVRALIPYVVSDVPQIYPGRSANVEETDEISTPTEERGDLRIRIYE